MIHSDTKIKFTPEYVIDYNVGPMILANPQQLLIIFWDKSKIKQGDIWY